MQHIGYCRVPELHGQRARPREDLRYCSCKIVAGKKAIEICCGNETAKTTKRHSVFCHKTDVCHQKPHVLLYTIAHQQHARNHVLLRGSCGKVAGTRDLRVCRVSKTRNSGAGQGLARGPHFHAYPRIVKVVMVFQWFSWSFQA